MNEKQKTVRVAAKDLRMVPIGQLIPYANNARKHDKRQIAQLQSSMRELGFVAPILIDGGNNVIAGHGRLEAAKAEGMTEVPCVLVDGLTEAQRLAYILADNRLAELATWDNDILKLELSGLQALQFDTGIIGFDSAALETFGDAPELSGGEAESVEPTDAAEDDYDGTVPETCPHKNGDVFRLGRHLLVCGDCTDPNITKNFQQGGEPFPD